MVSETKIFAAAPSLILILQGSYAQIPREFVAEPSVRASEAKQKVHLGH